jgi:hypothetical protein
VIVFRTVAQATARMAARHASVIGASGGRAVGGLSWMTAYQGYSAANIKTRSLSTSTWTRG